MKKGFSQVMWLFGPDHNITEVGTMNLFFVWKKKDGSGVEVVTAALTRGDILPHRWQNQPVQKPHTNAGCRPSHRVPRHARLFAATNAVLAVFAFALTCVGIAVAIVFKARALAQPTNANCPGG